MSGAPFAGAAVMTKVPTILPPDEVIFADTLEKSCPGDGVIYACDFYVEDAERWTPEVGGLRAGRILNVDHHARLVRMDEPLTSTRLAVDHVRTQGVAEPNSWVIINHTDCDSILSSGVMLGILPPDEDLVAASVAADHTGEPNDIADLLQALDEMRSETRTTAQYVESIRNLQLMRDGRALEAAAVAALESRTLKRAEAEALAARCERSGGLAFVQHEGDIDGAFVYAAVDDAVVIMLVRKEIASDTWLVKLRRGRTAPRGFSLHDLKVDKWDGNYGGRANAGSNKRRGGTTMSPDDYAERVRSRLRARLGLPEV